MTWWQLLIGIVVLAGLIVGCDGEDGEIDGP